MEKQVRTSQKLKTSYEIPMEGKCLSVEIAYLLKKAAHFKRWQFFGLALVALGVPLVCFTIFLVPIPTIQYMTNYAVWLMTAGCSLIFLGVAITIYHSWKLSLFVVQWSKVMEEMEKKVRESGY